jgi:hypothetical protein
LFDDTARALECQKLGRRLCFGLNPIRSGGPV